MTTAGTPVTASLAAWVATIALQDVPASVRDRAKHLLLDGVGCALLGAGLAWSRSATDAVCSFEGSRRVTPLGRAREADGLAVLVGTGRATSPSAAALLNSSYVQGFELDDYHPVAPLHSAP